ncbi:MAG: ATP-binding cassette domain-containing protein, partial [Actinobacteria bacterium]|nr:ATP-binding cassette domain-containing protein [Actinomycetota bacterium]
LVLVPVVAAAVAVPPTLSPFWQSALFLPIGLYVLLALGLNIVVGAAGLLDLGYVAFYAVGAYTTALLTTSAGWSAWQALPAAVGAAMVAGVALGGPTLRLRGDYLAIVTLGFGEIVRIVAENSGSLGENRGITGVPHPSPVAGTEFGFRPLPYYYLTLVAIVVTMVVFVRLGRSRVGRSWAAIREDEDAAEAMGVHTFTMKLWAFAMGASTAGLAGWIYAGRTSFISPQNFPFTFSVLILSAVVLGGMGSVTGAVAGALAVAFLPEYLRDVAAGDTITRWLNTLTGGEVTNIAEYRVLLFGAALVVVMVFRPQGLVPSRQRAAELAEAPPGQELAATAAVTEEPEPEAGPRADPAVPGPPVGTTAPVPTDLPVRMRAEADVVLELRSVTMAFGGVVAMNEVSLSVKRGEIFGIIGPNGAGKTTLFNCVTGVFRPTGGTIALNGRSVVGRKPH